MRRAMGVVAAAAAIVLVGSVSSGGPAVAGPIRAVQASGSSEKAGIPADGRYVVFDSGAANLVPGDTNNARDVFVRDLQSGTTTRVSVSSAGVQGNASSSAASISADGQVAAFMSSASNLVPGDRNGFEDIFVHNLTTGATQRVSVSSAGAQANWRSRFATLSADGNLVGFNSGASNLVSGDTNGLYDLFVHNVATGVTQRVNVSSAGAQADTATNGRVQISANGRFVAFSSAASNLVAGDTNGRSDAFERNLTTGRTVRVSVSSGGVQVVQGSYATAISANGRVVAFYSYAARLVPRDTNHHCDLFVHNLATGRTLREDLSNSGDQANANATVAAISADGTIVAFESAATNLVRGDTNGWEDVFVHNRVTGRTWRVSVSSSERQGNSVSLLPAISADGKLVAFQSRASNLVRGDTNGATDVFVRNRTTGTTQRVSVG